MLAQRLGMPRIRREPLGVGVLLRRGEPAIAPGQPKHRLVGDVAVVARGIEGRGGGHGGEAQRRSRAAKNAAQARMLLAISFSTVLNETPSFAAICAGVKP